MPCIRLSEISKTIFFPWKWQPMIDPSIVCTEKEMEFFLFKTLKAKSKFFGEKTFAGMRWSLQKEKHTRIAQKAFFR